MYHVFPKWNLSLGKSSFQSYISVNPSFIFSPVLDSSVASVLTGPEREPPLWGGVAAVRVECGWGTSGADSTSFPF